MYFKKYHIYSNVRQVFSLSLALKYVRSSLICAALNWSMWSQTKASISKSCAICPLQKCKAA